MDLAAIFRTLTSRLYWVIHSVWLVVLALGLCGNIVFSYWQLQADELRLLLSQNSIAANIVKAEVGNIAALLDSVENAAVARQDKDLLADRLLGIARSHPFVAAISVESNKTLIASFGTAPSVPTSVFMRSTVSEKNPGITVSIVLEPGFWERKLANVFNAAYAKVAIYTASGYPLLPFPRISQAETACLASNIVGMTHDEAMLHTHSMGIDGENSTLALRQVAAPFFAGGPMVVGTILNSDGSYDRWRSDMLMQVMAWVVVAVVSTLLLTVEVRRRRVSEVAAAKMHADMRARDKFISVLMDHAPIMVSYWDAECRCHYANRMYRGWFGKSEEQIIGMHVQTLLGDDLFAKCASLIAATLQGEPQNFEQERTRADGTKGYVLSRYIPDMDGENVRGFFVISSDVTELKQTQQSLEKRIEDLYSLATTDVLTGLSNRRNLLEKIQFEIERAKRYEQSVMFFMLDIDHFKNINDTFGHDAGDAVLKGLGALLQETMRTSDHVGRLGGEEFGILLIGALPQQAAVIAERLRKRVEAMVVWHNDWEMHFTVSIGMADLQTGVENPLADMMKRADLALYRAKQEGRNRVCLADNLLPPA